MSSIDWDLLEDERSWEIVNRIKPPLFTNASGDFLRAPLRGFGAEGWPCYVREESGWSRVGRSEA